MTSSHKQESRSVFLPRRRGLPNRTTCESGHQRRLAYFINCFPNFIETMIYREVKALRALGYDIHTVSIRRPRPSDVPQEARDAHTTTHYILPVNPVMFLAAHLQALLCHPARYLRLLFRLLLADHSRPSDHFRTLAHFAEGVAVAPVVKRSGVDHIHAHWAVGSATCAMVVADTLGIPFTFTAHAYDIWRDRLLLQEKLKRAELVITCTDYNRRHLIRAYGADPAKVHVVYHGVDVNHFHPCRVKKNAQPVLLSVGRLVEQKGFASLLQACAALAEEGIAFRCEIVGDGPLRQHLETLAGALGIAQRVHFVGRLFQEELINHYAVANVFVLPCVRASDNDRDGIPNTLIEALAMEIPVVSTWFSGIPELVSDGQNGLLVEPGNVPALTAALKSLLCDPERRQILGRAGRKRVLQSFTLERSAATLDEIFSSLPRGSRSQRRKALRLRQMHPGDA